MCLSAGCQQQFSSLEDVHTVASLLKLYLRELPEPLVPFGCYSFFQSAVRSKSHPSLKLWRCILCCRVVQWHGGCSGRPAKSSATLAKSQHQRPEMPCVSPQFFWALFFTCVSPQFFWALFFTCVSPQFAWALFFTRVKTKELRLFGCI